MPLVSPLLRRALPALIKTDSYQGTPSGPATDAPCRPAPIGRNCHRTLIRCASHQGPPAHDEGAFKSSSTFRASNFGDMLTPAFRGAGEPHVGRAPSPANTIR